MPSYSSVTPGEGDQVPDRPFELGGQLAKDDRSNLSPESTDESIALP